MNAGGRDTKLGRAGWPDNGWGRVGRGDAVILRGGLKDAEVGTRETSSFAGSEQREIKKNGATKKIRRGE